jgi:polysaccharide pyruvyl transferase WcaK-like protein
LLLLTGGGYLTDAFADLANRCLETTRLAARLGIPIAMMGQGLGPLTRPTLRKKLRESMEGVVMLGTREKLAGRRLLESIGASTGNVMVTGDDAIEMAVHDDADSRPLGTGLGINLRISSYSGLDQRTIDAVRSVARHYHTEHGAALVPVPISRFAGERDCDCIRQIFAGINGQSDCGEKIDSVEELVQQVGTCRVVLTGSYHGAVFALAQGISAVCVLRSGYYSDKFMGLADMFGKGCYVLCADDPNFARILEQTMEQAWQSAEANRPALLASARAQRQASRHAYEELHRRVS